MILKHFEEIFRKKDKKRTHLIIEASPYLISNSSYNINRKCLFCDLKLLYQSQALYHKYHKLHGSFQL
jgi:hypothetical protein